MCAAQIIMSSVIDRAIMDSPFRYRSVETWYSKRWVARRWAKPLHADEPWRRCEWRDRQRFYKLRRQITRTLVLQLRLKLLAFVIPVRSNIKSDSKYDTH